MTMFNHTLETSASNVETSNRIVADSNREPPQVRETFSELDFANVVQRFDQRFHAVAFRYLKNHSECSDAVQDAYLLALEHLSSFKGVCRMETWLHRIVVNSCLMRIRSRSHHSSVSLEAIDNPLFSTCVDEQDLSNEKYIQLRKAICRLPSEQRTIIQLRYYECFSVSETAELLGISTSAVKTSLHRIRLRLHRALTKSNDGHFFDEKTEIRCNSFELATSNQLSGVTF